MFDQLSSEIVPSLTKGRHNNNNNKAKCIPGGTLRVLAGKNLKNGHFITNLSDITRRGDIMM
jgi:hypothetical protein